MATYYMRADGVAANKEAATSADAASTAMSMSTHNSETFSAGDVIVLSTAGGVYRGTSGAVMTPPSNGASGNQIVYRRDPADSTKPIISSAADLTDTATYRWTASGSGTNEYYCELLAGGNPGLTDPNELYMDKVRLDKGTLGLLADHEWEYGDNDTLGYSTVYIADATGDPDTSGVMIEAPQANNAINVNGDDYLTFDGIETQMGKSNGIIVAGGTTGLAVQNCVSAYNKTNGILIFDAVDAVGTNMLFANNECHNNIDAGITMLEENNNITFRGNVCHDNCLLGTLGGNVGGMHIKCDDGKQSDNVTVENNICYDNGETGVAASTGFGFYIDTLGTGIVVRYNKSYGNNADGFVYEWTDSGAFYYNVTYSNNRHGFAFIRRCNSNTIYNNTSYGNGITDSSGANFIFNGVSEGPTFTESNNLIKNNIGFGANGKEVRVHSGWANDGTHGSGNVYDANILADQAGSFHNWNGTLYASASAWEAAASGVTNTDGSDPDVKDAANADFMLNPESPAVNAGIDVGLSRDINGNPVPEGPAPDLGAYEFSSFRIITRSVAFSVTGTITYTLGL